MLNMSAKKIKKNKKNVLYILGSGGHTAEMIILSKDIKDKINYFYLIQEDDELSENKIVYPGKNIFVNRNSGFSDNYFQMFFKTIILFFKAINIIRNNNVQIIISAGPGITVPFFYAGKLLKKKLIFIECFSRVTTKSFTGKLVYPLCNLFFVQWKDNLKNYPEAIYRGRLL
jgi:beta-1,4-N-acetylglucosaminyltransferase